MPYLVRKISRGRWPNNDYNKISLDILSADAITDLKTSDKTLSTWEISTLDDIEEAVLAMAANVNEIEKMDIISIDKVHITNNGLKIDENKPGKTHVIDLIETHKDITELSYKTLGEFSMIVLKTLEENRHELFTRDEVIEIVKKAIKADRLSFDSLSKKVKKQVE